VKYPEEWVTPMRLELARAGFRELHTAGEVDEVLGSPEGTTLLVINTFCPHAVRARPAVALALHNQHRPDHLITVFAGQDPAPTARARDYLTGYRPSSPAFALFDGPKLCFMMERDQILGRSTAEVASDLIAAFDRHCA
jgi:putative YphP/YqiW family bacilliredoxin